ncbi:MAG: LysE family transporter [Candidatus Kapabacteria bacterium]|nr:LysE family transporter [Candidatus Kapabacteria bacterium]
MIIALLVGALVGYVLAIPPGPIGMASVRTGLRDGWRQAIKLSVGAGLLDLIYCSLAMWASSWVVDLLRSMEGGNPIVTLSIQLVIVLFMIGFGIFQIQEHPVKGVDPEKHKRGDKLLSRVTSNGPFFVGVGFAVANLANPTFIPAVMAMTTFIQKMGVFEQTFLNAMAFSVGFGAGNTLWLMTLVRLVLAFRDKMTPKFIHRIQQGTGVTLILFAAFYCYRILSATPWDEIRKIIASV